jgi:preprotein translocase subunit YajC
MCALEVGPAAHRREILVLVGVCREFHPHCCMRVRAEYSYASIRAHVPIPRLITQEVRRAIVGDNLAHGKIIVEHFGDHGTILYVGDDHHQIQLSAEDVEVLIDRLNVALDEMRARQAKHKR